MKRLFYGLLMVLLLVALTGCGGGGGGSAPVGKTMTNDEVNVKFDLGLEGMDAVDMGMDYIGNPMESMAEAGYKAENFSFNWSGLSNGFKAFEGSTYDWESTGSGGWYTTQETVEGVTFTYWVRYLEASNTIELKELSSVDGETFSSIVSLSQSSDNKWKGSGKVTRTSSIMGKMVLDVTFANVDGTAHGSGTYKAWVTMNSDLGSIPKTLFADFTVSYDATKEPTPIKVTGWYGIGEEKYTFPDEWVPIPSEDE